MYYENFEQLCKQYKTNPSQVSKATGISTATLTSWKKGAYTPKQDKLQKIADHFNVTVDYLMTGKEAASNTGNADEDGLTARDKRDIAKDLDNIMKKLEAKEDGPASFDGEDLSPEAAELFREELKIALKRLKIINKEKYTPKKYKE